MNYCLYSLRFAFNRKVIEYENSSIKKVYDIFLSLRKKKLPIHFYITLLKQ
jgi:hypothetical protein